MKKKASDSKATRKCVAKGAGWHWPKRTGPERTVAKSEEHDANSQNERANEWKSECKTGSSVARCRHARFRPTSKEHNHSRQTRADESGEIESDRECEIKLFRHPNLIRSRIDQVNLNFSIICERSGRRRWKDEAHESKKMQKRSICNFNQSVFFSFSARIDVQAIPNDSLWNRMTF